MTEYLILQRVPESKDEGAWEPQAKKDAASGRAAVRAFLATFPDEMSGGEYVAIPARSWQPVKVQVETALKFS